MKRVKPKMASGVRLKKDQKIVVTIKRLGINGERSEERRVGKECRSRWLEFRRVLFRSSSMIERASLLAEFIRAQE
ncbi:tRNA (Uracil-5-)-methyltransferase [Pediococcus acidilactici D3]|nr:tRNA (Uracil-5-)-methyltransferase [Pediococcus acidilactici D3]